MGGWGGGGGLKETQGGKMVIMLTQLTVRRAGLRCEIVYRADKCPSADGRGREVGVGVGRVGVGTA